MYIKTFDANFHSSLFFLSQYVIWKCYLCWECCDHVKISYIPSSFNKKKFLMRKYCFVIRLATRFWLHNSTYFYNMSVIEQVTRVAMTQLVVYEIVNICNSCNYVAIKSLQLLCHYVVTIMLLHYSYCAIIL
jgi:hypothetical protein